jgi:molybdenum cofactor biosynthesis enzyme MoaA
MGIELLMGRIKNMSRRHTDGHRTDRIGWLRAVARADSACTGCKYLRATSARRRNDCVGQIDPRRTLEGRRPPREAHWPGAGSLRDHAR